MRSTWNIEYYQLPSGDKPVEKFICSLEKKTQAKVIRTTDLLKEFGVKLRSPFVKKITNTLLWELRILGSDNLRIFYILNSRKEFILLHGFKKKTQQTQKKEIRIALQRLKTMN